MKEFFGFLYELRWIANLFLGVAVIGRLAYGQAEWVSWLCLGGLFLWVGLCLWRMYESEDR